MIISGLLCLGVAIVAFFFLPGSDSKTEGGFPAESLVSEDIGNSVDPSETSEDKKAKIVEPTEKSVADSAIGESKIVGDEDTPLADQTAKELLFQNTEILESEDRRLGFSNRVIRRTLYRTSFKYPLLLKKETLEIKGDGEESVVSEELMVGDHVLVQLPEGLDEAAFEQWGDANGYAIRHRLRTAPIVLLSSANPDVETVEKLQSDLGNYFQQVGEDPLIQIVEPDFVNFPTVTPNDSSYSSLWGLHNIGQSGGSVDADIDAPEAWDITTDASDVLVGVIDTGVDRAHPDLSANMWTNPLEIAGNGIDDDNNGFIDDVNGWDFYQNDNDPTDGGSHGTHCAGTIGAAGGNGTGVVGVCWDASMVGIRFLGPAGGSTSDAIESVNYATILGADLTSNSWGGGGFSSLLLQAIENGSNAGILFVAAAGNESVNNDVNPHYPSSYGSDAIISVAASDRNDAMASFSNWGQASVDLAAPGVSTYSTVPNGGHGYKSGTSMATPHVSGALALLRSIAPQLSHMELKQQLLESVDPVPAFSQNTVTGGRMNLHSAMLQAGGASLQMNQFSVTDNVAGNGNGIVNPGEPVDIQFNVINQGADAAANVTASLISEPGSVFSGGTDVVDLGAISAGQGITVPSAFQITANAQTSTPYQEDVSIRLEWGNSPRESRDFPVTLTVLTSSVISGRVTTISGAPIFGATVAYSGPGNGTVMTTANGNYQFNAIDGSYLLSAGAATYADSAPRSVTVPPNQSGIDFALGKPQLQVSPPSFSLNLLSGETVTRILTMTNAGDSALSWSLSAIQASSVQVLEEMLTVESDPDSPGAETSEVFLPSIEMQSADLTGSQVGFLSSWSYSGFEGDLTQRGAQLNETINFPLGTNELDGLDIIIVDDIISSATASDINVLRDWVTNGGGLMLIGDNSDSVANMNGVLSGSGIQEIYRGSFETITVTDIDAHPTTLDVSSVYSSQSGTYLTLSNDAVSLMREPDGAAHAAAGRLGAGRIVAVGNELISSSSLTTGDTRLFANQVVDWLDRGVAWLTASPEEGLLAPGSSASVTLTIDASSLVAGSYSQNLVIDSNDPVSSQLLVPVDLLVNGTPSISVVQTQLSFGDTSLGQNSTGTVTIRSVGTDALNVGSLASTAPEFTILDTPPVIIEPGNEFEITVRFAPTSAGPVSGNLVIGSNDPVNGSVQVQLSGQGFVAPVIGGRVTALAGGGAIENATITYSGPTAGTATTDSNGNYSFIGVGGTYTLAASGNGFSSDPLVATIPPDRLDLDFALGSPQITINPGAVSLSLAAGDSETRIVSINNPGNVSLNWTSTLAQAAGQSLIQLPERRSEGEDPDASTNETGELLIPSAEASLSDLSGLRIGLIFSSSYSTFLNDLTIRGAQLDSTISFPITNADLQSVDVLLVDDSITSASTADLNLLRQWLFSGGGVLLMGDNGGSISQNNAVLRGSGIEEGHRGGYTSVTMTDIATHPSTNGIASVYGSAAGAYCTVSGDAKYLVQDSDGKIHAAAGTIGSGRIVAVGDEIALDANFSTGDARQFSNQVVDWLSFGANFNWITVNPSSGNVSASGQTDVSLEFDSTGLVAGSYSADWVIDSNDINTPQLTVPVNLQVNGAPNMVVSPLSQLQFSNTYTGRVTSLPVAIRNTGSDDLTISSLSFSVPQFSTLEGLPLVIAPGATREVSVVFTPDSGNTFSGALTIISNDPTEGTINLGLLGTGISAPSFSVSPTPLDLVVLAGENLTESLEIKNGGEAELNWTGTIGEASSLSPIYQVDWDGSPHAVGQTTATGGPNAPSTIHGTPKVRQSAGGMLNRPVELVGGPGGGYNYSQLRFDMGGRAEKVVVEFDLQKLDSDDLVLFFDVPTSHRADFNETTISFSGIVMPYDSSAVNRIRIEYEIATMTTSLSLNGGTPVSTPISVGSATALMALRFSADDRGVQGGTVIDNLIIGTENAPPVDPPENPFALYEVDWDESPHIVNQITAIGGTSAPSTISLGSPTVRQSAGAMLNRPLEFVGGSGGSLNYSQIKFDMGGRTEKVILEFKMQKLDSDSFRIFFNFSGPKSIVFSDNDIGYSGFSMPSRVNYDSSKVNRIRIEVEFDTLTASISVNGATPISGTIPSNNAVGLGSIIFSINDQGTAGGVLIDDLVISTDGQGGSSLSGTSQVDWLTMTPLSGSVQAGQTQTAQVTVDAGSLLVGEYNTTLEFQSNDPQNATVTMPVMVSVVGEPEIEIKDGGITLTDDGAGVSFQDVIGERTVSRILTISNTGTGALTGLTTTIDGSAASDFTAGNFPATLLRGQSWTMEVSFDPTQFGDRAAVLHIASNDSDESPFDIALSGTSVPEVPEIEVEAPGGTFLTSGEGEVLLPNVVGNGTSELTLKVHNTGTSSLRGLAVSIDGDSASSFSRGFFPGWSLSPGQYRHLVVIFQPLEAGELVATISIASNDPDENPFEISIKGTATPNQTTFQSWAETYGLTGTSALSTADNDGDTISLIEEYAFNLDPKSGDNQSSLVPGFSVSGLPLIRLVGDRLQIEYVRRNTDSNLTYRVMFGSELSTNGPSGMAAPAEVEMVTPIDPDWSRVIVNDSATVESSSKRFGRVEIEIISP